MMGKTHILIGTAFALLVKPPETNTELIAAIIGGSAGGIILDIDIKSSKYNKEALNSKIITVVLCITLFVVDYIIEGDISKKFASQNSAITWFGLGLFFLFSSIGYVSSHRGFTHSIFSLLLFSIAVNFINDVLTPYFVAGYFSHIVIDLLNKKRVKLFFPYGKGFCLSLFYANKFADKVLLGLGLVITGVYIIKTLL